MDTNKKLEEALKALAADPKTRAQLESAVSSPKAARVKNSLTESEKRRILDAFGKMDKNEVRRRLAGADLAAMSKLGADDIVRMLKKL